MRIRVLGCDGGIGDPLRTSALLVDDDVLLDAGTGVGDLSLSELIGIEHVFITHAHVDHIASLPLLLDAVVASRSRPITVYATDGNLRILKTHIFKGLVPATWTHVIKGVQDLYGQVAYDYENIQVWQQRRPDLAYAVRDWMRANDSAACRTCHEEESIKPARKRGRRQHEEAREEGMTCIDCHYNLVHEEVEPRESFLDSAGKRQ